MPLDALGGLIGYALSGDDRDRAQREMDAALGAYGAINAPGVMTAEADPYARGAQLEAIQRLREQASGAPTLADRAEAAQLRQGQEQATRGATLAAINAFRGGGQAGSGAALNARLAAASDAANRAAGQGNAMAAAAGQRQMGAAQAMGGAGAGLEATNAAIRAFNAGQRQAGFENQMGLAGARQGTAMQGARFYQGRADQAVNLGSSIGGDLDQAGAAAAGYALGRPAGAQMGSSIFGPGAQRKQGQQYGQAGYDPSSYGANYGGGYSA